MRRNIALAVLGVLLIRAGSAAAQTGQLPAVPAVAAVPAPEAPPCTSHEDCCCPCDVCAPEAGVPQCWVSGEYLLWWIKSASLPVPLVTTGGTSPTSAGALSDPSTRVLFGDTTLNSSRPFSGGRFTAGGWLASEGTLGLEGSFLFLGQQNLTGFQATSQPNGSPVLAQPFLNAASGAEISALTSFPGAFAGSIRVNTDSSLWGYEADSVFGLFRGPNGYVNLLAGYRYLDLSEDLAIGSERSVLANGLGSFVGFPVINDGSIVTINDDFHTRNQFYGGQLGTRAEFRRGRASINLLAKVAVGDMHETVDIHGNTFVFPPNGAPIGAPGGLLAQPTNSGHHTRDQFAVVPEATLTLGYNLTSTIRATIGYSFLYLNEVVRPGEQIDRELNVTQIPTSPQFSHNLQGPSRPALVDFKTTDFWAQGINFGLLISF